MNLSVVIACRDGGATLDACLRSVLASTSDSLDVIVADDGSADDSAGIAERAGARVLRLPRRGRAHALNSGIEAATGDLILFTDSDCVVPPGWPEDLARLVAGGYASVGGNLLPSAWTVVETAKILRYLHEFEVDEELVGEYSRWCLNGNNMAIRKTALEAVGGFDEGYLHGADADLTRRLLRAGFRLLRTRAITTTHLKIDDLASFRRTFYMRGSAVRFAMTDRSLGARDWLSAALSPIRRALADYTRVAAMKRVFPAIGWGALLAAPVAHALADWSAARGQRDFYRRFRAESSR
ncbi:MAG: glycosyltransferase family 2 protein [Deltaproteobacteria bacterium]|nr:glycosyltransferase family 2 protein [Deltaproteobacteria bacterium]